MGFPLALIGSLFPQGMIPSEPLWSGFPSEGLFKKDTLCCLIYCEIIPSSRPTYRICSLILHLMTPMHTLCCIHLCTKYFSQETCSCNMMSRSI